MRYEEFTNERFIPTNDYTSRCPRCDSNNACSTRIIRPLPSSIKGRINFVKIYYAFPGIILEFCEFFIGSSDQWSAPKIYWIVKYCADWKFYIVIFE